MTKQITKAQFISEQIEESFFSEFREMCGHHSGVDQGISSFLKMNYTIEELQAAPMVPGAYRKMLANALITLVNREALTLLTPYNESAEADLDRLRKETDIDVELIPAPAPLPPTAEELLEQEVRSDWRTLSMDKVRQKKNGSRKYSETLERLANAGTLESSVTALTRAGA